MARTLSPNNMDDDSLAVELDGLEKHERDGSLGTVAARRLKKVRAEFQRRFADAI